MEPRRHLLVDERVTSPVRKDSTMNLRHLLELARIELRSEDGQTMTEYGVLLALIAVVVIAILLTLGPQIFSVFDNVSSAL
jgi:pilus assembly protein Flp/PilA